jgi:hypothetical protein
MCVCVCVYTGCSENVPYDIYIYATDRILKLSATFSYIIALSGPISSRQWGWMEWADSINYVARMPLGQASNLAFKNEHEVIFLPTCLPSRTILHTKNSDIRNRK